MTDKCLEVLSRFCSNTLTTLDVNGCVGIKVWLFLWDSERDEKSSTPSWYQLLCTLSWLVMYSPRIIWYTILVIWLVHIEISIFLLYHVFSFYLLYNWPCLMWSSDMNIICHFLTKHIIFSVAAEPRWTAAVVPTSNVLQSAQLRQSMEVFEIITSRCIPCWRFHFFTLANNHHLKDLKPTCHFEHCTLMHVCKSFARA